MFKVNGIKISKYDWINIGIHAGWIKTSHMGHAPNVYDMTAHMLHYRSLYEEHISPVIKKLAVHLQKGLFNKEMALASFERIAHKGIEMYIKEHGEIDVTPMIVRSIAENLLDNYMEEITDELLTISDENIVSKNKDEKKKAPNKRRDRNP